MKRVVMGIVDTPLHAQAAIERLVAAGIAEREISVLYPDRHGAHDFAFESKTKSPEGALIGIGLGAVLGATLGIALGIAGLIPAVALLVQTGPLLTALAGAAIGAFTLGVPGAVIGAFVPEIEARHYEGKVRIGTILVGVHADNRDQVRNARLALQSVAATDVQTTGEAPLPVSSY